LKRGIVFCFISQAEDEERHDPGVLPHLFDKAVTIATEHRHFSDTFVNSPHRMRCEGRLFPGETAAAATWAETAGTQESKTEAPKEVSAGMKEGWGAAHKLHERSLLVRMVHSQGEDLLVNLPCVPANFLPRNPHRLGDTGDVCDQKGTMGTRGREKHFELHVGPGEIPGVPG
jgi:hypothetical protein